MKTVKALLLAGCLWLILGASIRPAGGVDLPTLVTITVDGGFSDWQAVLANPVQVSNDGDGSSFGTTCVGSPDRDCEVTGGTGRDLLTFAWTYDPQYIYFYIERWGSSSNIITFFFVMDLDSDGLAETTDRVARVRWNGSNRTTRTTLWDYVPLNSGGDSLVDANGFADGWDMEGNIGTLLITYPARVGGDANGLRFEERLPWADLNLAPGTPIYFHVASNNSTDLAGVVDNMGDPSGRLGTFGFGGVFITPSWTVSVASPGSVTLKHTITNPGNIDDAFVLTGTSTLGLSLSYRVDTTLDGNPDTLVAVDLNGDGDFGDAGESLDPAFDTNGDGLLDFFIPGLGGLAEFWVQADVPAGLFSIEDRLRFRVWMDSLPGISDQAEDVLAIGAISIFPDLAKTGVETGFVEFAHLVANHSGADDVAEYTAQSLLGWTVTLYSDPDQDGLPDLQLAQDLTGDGNWDSVEPGADSNGNGNPDSGLLGGNGGTTGVVARVDIPLGSVGMQEISVVTVNSASVPGMSDTATDRTDVQPRLTLEPSYEIANDTNLYGSAGASVYFPFVLTNAWTSTDDIRFSASLLNFPGTWSVILWTDPNGDGNIADGGVINFADAFAVPAMGGTFHLVAEVQVSTAAVAPEWERVTLTASSTTPGISAVTVGELEVHILQTFRDHLFTFQASSFSTCETVYTEASGLDVGQVDRYELLYWDDGSPPVLIGADALVSDARGQAHTSRMFGDSEPLGPWSLELTDTLGLHTDTVTVAHERSGTIGPVVVFPDPLMLGEDLRVSATFVNTNQVAPYSATLARTRVFSPSGDVLLENGSFVPVVTGDEVTNTGYLTPLAPGDSATHGFTVAQPAFPETGLFNVEISWRKTVTDPGTGTILCDAEIASAVFQFEVMVCAVDADCDDGVSCTVDTCDLLAGLCTNVPSDAACDDGLFCTGVETCDAFLDCQTGEDPCLASAQMCDEANARCVDCFVAGDCDDGVSCTSDSCDSLTGTCTHNPNDGLCTDGLFCTGTETCDSLTGCQAGVNPCLASGQICDEGGDQCVDCAVDADCDDGVACTVDSCDAVSGTCQYTPDDALCDDSLFCTGDESCDVLLGCQPGTDPCTAGGQLCDEANLRCVDCLADGDCDDGVACTDDTCDTVAGTCVHTPNDGNCPDNGQYCDGAEICDAASGCLSTGDPCTASGQLCDEANDRCVACLQDGDCTDGVPCTADTCDVPSGSCAYTPDDDACNNGVYCDGDEVCDPALGCLTGSDPCLGTGLLCDETGARCVECLVNGDCDDLVACTDDSCDPVGGTCGFSPNNANCPDDGLHCNGSEYCDAVAGCLSSGDPCLGSGLICDEDSDSCVNCVDDSDCNDGIACTNDSCDVSSGTCQFAPDDANCPDDGVFCNGAEVCAALQGCVGAGDPCLSGGQMCDEAGDRCADCLADADCDDGDVCTQDACQPDGTCLATYLDSDNDGVCDGEDPCPDDPWDSCVPCDDTDGDGICDAFDICPDDPTNTCQGCPDDDGDGICNVNDPCPQDPDNQCVPCDDTDGDGLCDDVDPCPTDPDNLCAGCVDTSDPDGDGQPNCVDPCPDDPFDSCVPCDDTDGDGICDAFDPCPDDPTNTCGQCADDDGDGICNAIDECPQDPLNECVCTDTDGDGLCDDVDPCPTDPDNLCAGCVDTADPDGDGLPNCVDPCPNDPLNRCLACVDSDGDGICDAFDICPDDPTDSCTQCADDDGDGICNAVDECPDDPDNQCIPCTDDDADGICDNVDPCPDDPTNECGACVDTRDTDGDGKLNCVDPCPDDPLDLCVPCNDRDHDGICDAFDVCPDDPTDTCPECADDDGDGICNPVDQCPQDPENLCIPCADFDEDGLCDDVDPCPGDPDNTCGACVDQGDDDGDGQPNCADPCPDDPDNTCVPCSDRDHDGACDDDDPCPDDASDACVACDDADGDGRCDADDPCPQDAEDLCVIWDGSDVTGGGCGCATHHGAARGPLDALLWVLCLVALRRRYR